MKNLSMRLIAITMIFMSISNIKLQAKGWDPTSADSWKKVGGAFGAPKQGDVNTPCKNNSSCDSSNYCLGGMCQARPGKNGTLCMSNSDCNSHACVDNFCSDKLDKGDVCSNDGQCKDKLYCSDHAGDGRYKSRYKKCDSQKNAGAQCQSDRACKSGKCEGHTKGNYGTCSVN